MGLASKGAAPKQLAGGRTLPGGIEGGIVVGKSQSESYAENIIMVEISNEKE